MKENFTQRDIDAAMMARTIYRRIGRPGKRRFLELIDNNLLPGCPVTRQDAINVEKIWGPDVGALKGKTTRQKLRPVRQNIIEISNIILYSHFTLVFR